MAGPISLKANMAASYAAQIYVAAAGIIVLPLYVHFMGSEAYGLVAIFVMLQGWLLLLDMGLSPTLAREMAQFRAGAVSGAEVRRLLHLTEGAFAILAGVSALAMIVGAPWLARHWLRVEQLPDGVVVTSLTLMGPALGLRLCSGLYRGAVSGLERIVWLSGFNAAIATLRFLAPLLLFLLVGTTPVQFFAFQLAVALIEAAILRFECHRLMHASIAQGVPGGTPRRLRQVLFFSATVGISGSLWSVLAQLDKLVLSKLLSLADYGRFSLAVVAASGVLLATGPITFALSPRLAHLYAGGRRTELIELYHRSTQLIAVVAASSATLLACFSRPVLLAWTGRVDVADTAATTLSLYAVANGLNAVSVMPFFLQFAMGDLRLHLRGVVLLLVLLLPSLFWATLHYGMVGAGAAWLGVNVLYFVVWTALAHRRFTPGVHLTWLWRDVARVVLPVAVVGIAARLLLPLPVSRTALVVYLGMLGFLLAAVAVASAASHRARLIAVIRDRLAPR